jgi:lipopolysaccharide/colanic/teichoic acid biosynthesis glycosyltransferase
MRDSIKGLRFLFDKFAKRFLDIYVSLIGLILCSPFFVLIAWLIKRDSPGPILFNGPRVGKDNRVFYIHKFRTMREEPASYQGPKVTAQDDPRITRLGRFLRDAKLNELPQMWNVLKGEMSLVGPRPEDPEIAASWPERVRQEILSVRPGITSPASVLYRDEETLLNNNQVMSTYLDSILPSKLRLDQLYVRNRSFWLDLDVLLWTILVLLPRVTTKSYEPKEEILFWGPVSRLIQRYVRWFIVDAITTFTAFGITGLIWRSFGPLDVGWPKAVWIALGFSLLFSLAGAVLGMNRIDWLKAPATDVYDMLPAVIVAACVVFIVNHVSDIFPAGMMITASFIAFAGFVAVRYRSRLLTGLLSRLLGLTPRARGARERVLIVGGGEAGQFIVWMLDNNRNRDAFHVVGYVDDDLYKQGVRIRGVNVVGKRDNIPQLVEQHDIGIIIFAIHNISKEERKRLLEICHQTPAKVFMSPDFLGALNNVADLRDSKPVKYNDFFECPSGSEIEISKNKVIAWLEELDLIANTGDLSAVSERIKTLLSEVEQNDVSEIDRKMLEVQHFLSQDENSS